MFTRAYIETRKNSIYQAHLQGQPGLQTCEQLTALADEVIEKIARAVLQSVESQIVVLALGGYGRGELNPFSDVDLLLIFDKESAKIQEAIRQLIRALWDCGLEVGHQTQSISQCVQLSQEDWVTRTTVLEMRRLFGSQELMLELENALRRQVLAGDQQAFWQAIIRAAEERHKKYGGSPQLLEPHVKEGVGGLRDLHTLLWLYRSNSNFYSEFHIRQQRCSSIAGFLQQLYNTSIILASEYDKLLNAFEFLLRVRNELHFLKGNKFDLLEYGLQRTIAQHLGYQDEAEHLGVETFLREYYLNARSIYHAYLILSEKLSRYKSTVEPSGVKFRKFLAPGIYLGEDATIYPESDSVEVFKQRPLLLMEVFYWCKCYHARLSEFLRQTISHFAHTIDEAFRTDPAAFAIFEKILSHPEDLGRILRIMHELEVLDNYIPEFSALTALAQHDLYHYYSTDEHTLLAIENIARLVTEEQDQAKLRQVFLEIKYPEVLFLGMLFHDIGKVKRQNHAEEGAKITAKILDRWNLYGERRERIIFLVRHHLEMEQIAFRRNFDELPTLREFAALVGDVENLKMLYLLSYGDLSALNPNIWSEWKSILLWDLYLKTRDYLTGGYRESGVRIKELQLLIQEIQKQSKQEISAERIENHLRGMNSNYLQTFDERQIAEHLDLIAQLMSRAEAKSPEKKAAIAFYDYKTHWGVTVVTQDKPFRLAEICGVLSVNDLNIFSAQIFTRQDGIVIDTFQVTPISEHLQFDEIKQRDLREDLEKVLSGQEDLRTLFQLHQRRWRRRKLKRSGRPAEIRFDNQISSEFTIIDVFTDYSVGLLYRLAMAMSKLKLDIRSAKISTRVDQVADSFYVLDANGQKIVDQKRQEEIRQQLLRATQTEF
ncbi:[protein-PII] uridylyltransferase [candidate division KSB1 bacterium]|nr:MAG: [protein-PII] uridylyltransferase [candidate division KSB1 bacterium]